MHRHVTILLAAVAGLGGLSGLSGLSGCSASLTPEGFEGVCVAGETQGCTCPGGGVGEQVCAEDASGFSDCDCPQGEGEGDDGECDDVRVGDDCEVRGARGQCVFGKFRCDEGAVLCFALNLPTDELCNGLDDDCDGQVDDGDPETGQECDTGGLGICAVGSSVCNVGQLGCIPTALAREETCDGLDDDCDGQTDEAFAGMCDACVDGEAEGICGTGVTVCLDGAERCAPHLPADWAPPAAACDGLDSDCDGTVDELAEGLPTEAGLVEKARSACLLAPTPPEPAAPCPDDGGRTQSWACAPADGGGACVAQACDEGFRIEDGRCVPDVERCNDGVDDDGDGLVDGSVGGADPCMPTIDPRGETWIMGKCAPAFWDQEGCEDSEHRSFGSDEHTICRAPQACPRRVRASYRYALDREEVSLRAYLQCVESGCCSPAAGRLYELGERAKAEGLAPARRPDDVDACAKPPQLSLEDPDAAALLLDLPVVGVSWCQARNYCAWAGKRLPTEFEWDRAQNGPDPQRRPRYAWGDQDPVGCPEDLCLGTWRAAPEQCGHLDPRADCPRCIYGAAPVWSGADGATPEGLLNMAGNVEEWVFDWFAPEYTYLGEDDPVGRACHGVVPHTSRVVRDGNFRDAPENVRAGARAGHPQAAHLTVLGFRCGRTLPEDDAVCDPEVPLTPASCAGAGADAGHGDVARPTCGAPDFVAAEGGDLHGCDGPGREQTDHCLLGLVGLCDVEPASCGAQIISRVELSPEALFDHLPPDLLEIFADVLADLLEDRYSRVNALAEGVMAPSGGDTILMLDVPEDFGRTFPHQVRVGGGIIGRGGVLSWIGEDGPDGCQPAPRAELTIPTVAGSLDFVGQCQLDDTALWMVEAPIRFRIAASRWQGEITATGLAVSALGLMTLADAEASVWGDPRRPADAFLAGVLDAVDLCPIGHILDCDQPFPGCVGEGLDSTCSDPQTCSGYLLPFVLETVRRDLLDLPGMAPCEPDG